MLSCEVIAQTPVQHPEWKGRTITKALVAIAQIIGYCQPRGPNIKQTNVHETPIWNWKRNMD